MRQILDQRLFPALTTDERLNPSAIILYQELYRLPVVSAANHVRRSSLTRHTVHRGIAKLKAADWVYIKEDERTRSSLVIPSMPLDLEQALVSDLLQVRNDVSPLGEWLMKCILDLTVADLNYRDNARPHWLVSGDGSGRLEIDRWYRAAKVGIEFQGMQHYEPRDPTRIEEFRAQVMRDTIKAGLFTRRKKHYVEIPANNLSIEYVTTQIQGLLPLRPIMMDRPLATELANLCHSYVNATNKGRQ